MIAADYVVNSFIETLKDAISDLKSNELESKVNQKCYHNFGYLADLPPDSSIPKECLLCSKIAECFLNLLLISLISEDQ
jgi:hypothetical protein